MAKRRTQNELAELNKITSSVTAKTRRPLPATSTRGHKRLGKAALTRRILHNAQQSGELPLEYMLRVMRNDKANTERRDEMARAAAPYIHPRLSSVEVLRNMTDADLDQLIAGLAPQAGVSISITGAGSQVAVGISPGSGPAPVAIQTKRRQLLPSAARGASVQRTITEEPV